MIALKFLLQIVYLYFFPVIIIEFIIKLSMIFLSAVINLILNYLPRFLHSCFFIDHFLLFYCLCQDEYFFSTLLFFQHLHLNFDSQSDAVYTASKVYFCLYQDQSTSNLTGLTYLMCSVYLQSCYYQHCALGQISKLLALIMNQMVTKKKWTMFFEENNYFLQFLALNFLYIFL